MFRLVHYIKHFLVATNQHGVHSPFVFDYVTTCLYANKKFSPNKALNIFLKSIDYFNPNDLYLISDKPQTADLIKSTFPKLKVNKTSSDFIYIDDLKTENTLQFVKTSESIKNETVILVSGIYEDKDRLAAWKKLKSLSKVQVSIDVFHCGILFFRKEQAEQHFKIRS